MAEMTKRKVKEYIDLAKDLMYDFISESVFDEIKACKTDEEVSKVLTTYRMRSDKMDWSFLTD